MVRKRLGELLVERGAISQAQLQAGLSAQQRTRQKLGLTLIQQGVLTEAQLAQVLAESLGLTAVDLQQVEVDWSAVHTLQARFCETHELFPLSIEGKGSSEKRLVVALSDPLNQAAMDEIEFTTGLKVVPCVATHSQVREAILRTYHRVALPPGDEDVIVGEEVISASFDLPETAATADPALEQLITERMVSSSTPKDRRATAVSKDLAFLFGGASENDEAVAKLERKFWALLRLMARKGLITREEFLTELGGDE